MSDNDLAIFTDEENALLVSLPFKAGAYISHSDDVDGEDDDEKEMRALKACIRAVAQKYDGPGIVDDIAREALRLEDQWGQWEHDSFHVLSEAKEAIAIIKARATEKDAKNFRSALLEIATTVAQAYGEFDAFDEVEPEPGFFSGIANKIVSGMSSLSRDDKDHPMNISAAEDSAISRLSAALKVE